MISSIKGIGPTPLCENLPHTMILALPCLTVFAINRRLHSMLGERRTKFLELVLVNNYILNSFDNKCFAIKPSF